MLTEPAFTETELALRWNISPKTLQRRHCPASRNGRKWVSEWRIPAAAWPVSHVPFHRQSLTLDE